MEMNKELEDQSKLKEGIITALKCLSAISSAASTINPIFGVAGSLIDMVLAYVDNEEMCKLKREFDSVDQLLDKFLQQSQGTLLQIRKEAEDAKFCEVEQSLRNQFRTFMEMVESRPEYLKQKKEDFKESYANDKFDQHLNTLYDSVMGKEKSFSRPILEVYKEHSQGDRGVMEQLCTRLMHLFHIGLIARMGYASVSDLDVESEKEKWEKNMEEVQDKMEETMHSCK